MNKWWSRQRAEREQVDAIIRSTPLVGQTDGTSVYEFSASDRADARMEKEREDLKANAAALNGLTFETTGWVFGVLEHMGKAWNEKRLEVVNVALDPEPEAEEPKRYSPAFVHRVGVTTTESPLPITTQIGSKITKLKGVPRSRGQ